MRTPPALLALLLPLLPLASSARADVVTLINGDELHGSVVEHTDTGLVLQHPVLGRITLGLVQLQGESMEAIVKAATTPVEEEVAKEAAEEEAAQAEGIAEAAEEEAKPEPHPGLFGTGFLLGWEKQIAAGVSGNEGNTKTTEFNSRIGFKFENDERRWDLSAAYFYSRDDGSTTKNQAIVQALRDFLFPESAFFLFLASRYDYNEFEPWEHRVAANGGVGYEFIKRETWTLRGRLGAGVKRTFGSEKDWTPEGLAGLEGAWRVNDALKFEASNTFYPALNEAEFRNISKAGWTVDISSGRGLKLAAGVINEYDSTNSDKKNDLKYIGSLLYDF